MKRKFSPNFFMIVIAVVVGAALFRQIDFKQMTVEKPALSAIYALVFVVSIVLMFPKHKK